MSLSVRSQSVHVAIIGAGVIGSATAAALIDAGIPAHDIVLIERDPAFTVASTPRSAGGIRQQFSTPENIAMSLVTRRFLETLPTEVAAATGLKLVQQGYLILASPEGARQLEANHAIQRESGADNVLLSPDELAQRFPWLDTSGIACGCFGTKGEGWIDPVALMTYLRTSARAKGVAFIAGDVTRVRSIAPDELQLTFATGATLVARHVVNAAGPWAGALAARAGLTLPVEPRKRYVYVIDCQNVPEALHQGPLLVDPSGVWFRPDGKRFICGVSPEESDEPSAVDLDAIDHAPFEDIVWPRLAERVPAFNAIKVFNAWAGFYDYNTLDQNAVIGPHPEMSNFYFANGFSGHGLQHAIPAGRAIAELIAYGEFRSIDLTRFGYDRIRRSEPLLELNVI
jgi:sarcosine oxidase